MKTPLVFSPVHVRVLLPLLLMVSVVVVFAPTCTSPNAILPDSAMMRVAADVVATDEVVNYIDGLPDGLFDLPAGTPAAP